MSVRRRGQTEIPDASPHSNANTWQEVPHLEIKIERARENTRYKVSSFERQIADLQENSERKDAIINEQEETIKHLVELIEKLQDEKSEVQKTTSVTVMAASMLSRKVKNCKRKVRRVKSKVRQYKCMIEEQQTRNLGDHDDKAPARQKEEVSSE